MMKNYTIKSQALFSFLLLLSFNFTALAQSKTAEKPFRLVENTNSGSAQNTARNRSAVPTNPGTQATTTVTACQSYTWPVNGQTYTVSGTYTSGGGATNDFSDQTAWNNSAAAFGATVATNSMAGIPAATTMNVMIGTTNVTLTAPNGMYTSGTFVGVNNASEAVTMTFNPPIYGISGNFFTTDISDNVANGNVTTTYSNGHVISRNVNTDTDCFGYFSTTPLTSLVVSTATASRFISLKNLSIATNPAANDTLNLTILNVVSPTFPAVNPICEGSPLAALPTTSNNGITGTWSPALDNMHTTTYTFTPDSGQCASTKTVTINVFPYNSNTTFMAACNSYTWPITGLTYNATGQYTTSIPIIDTVEIDNLNSWAAHAFSFNSSVYIADVSSIPATNPTTFTMGSTNISMSAPGGMYSGPDFLGTANPNNPITITFNPPVYGVSANYFTTDINDNVISGNVTVTYSNGHVQSRTVTTNSDTFGYFDNNFISSIVLSSSSTVPNHYVGLKDLAIAANPTSCSTQTLDLTINTATPPGDTFAAPIVVNTPTYSASGNNLSSNCYTDNGGEVTNDVWYRVDLDGCAETLSVDTCTGTNFDTILTVFAQDGTTVLGYSDDDCGITRQSSISDIDVSNETVVYVMVEAYFGLGEEEGTYGLNITQTLAPRPTTIFQPVAGICRGDVLAPLPTTSDNGITGTWAPALDNTTTTTYTFTPDPGICASQASLTINVTQPTTPTFNAVAPICSGGTLSPLPTTSLNGYTGSWSPALNNTTTTTYTFTPTAGQCASTATLTITVNQPVTPTFNAVAAICNGDALTALPTTSLNGYTGSWSPALNNTLTTTYTFTPTAGQCATTASLTITVNQPITPTFTQVAPICNGDSFTLPTTSNNSYVGSWSPAINNTATTTYTFTPTPGQCATTATMTVTVNQPITPTFTAVAAICNGDSLSALPTTSNNGYLGSWSPALNNALTTTYTFTPNPGQCATTASLTITVNQPVTPTFTPRAPICNGDTITALPTTSNNGYTGNWSPPLDNTTTTTYTFTPTIGQCATTTTLTITVNQPITPTFNAIAPICNGDALTLPTTSTNGYTGSWLPAVNNTATTTYTFTPTAGQCAITATLTVTVNQPITPTFNPVAAICNGDSLSALPTTSLNGYTGIWTPALNNALTTTYTFTPTAGQCATTASLTITVNQPITPTFDPVAAICNGDSLTALPTTSNNGYTGSWAPALDNSVTTTYTFTPDAGQCATTALLTITVNQPTVATFTAVAPICNGDSLTALPTTSNNGFTGTWAPALDNTSTTTYTFTPNAGQCALATTLTIIVNQPVIPTFNPIAPICNGDASPLALVSTNGISGTWLPVFDTTTTTTYTFTPNVGECALTTTLTVTVNQPVTPVFDPVTDICNGDTLTALPTTSNNGYTGSWSPALNNTLTTTYTFTPDAGQCATSASLTIIVNQPITPTFDPVASICNGDALLALPTTSLNGYTGSWSPALDNTLTTTYTFTPDAGQCATTASLTITVNQPITPTFDPVIGICNGDALTALPTTSNNGYTGSWSPALDNTATTIYTFTPDAGQCAATASLTITVNQPITPTFTAIAPICNGASLLPLPTTSNNGVTGSWSPALDNTATTTYTFTPDAGQCAAVVTLTITVNQPVTPTFNPIAPICNGDASPLPLVSTNLIVGIWTPAFDATATATYTFTPIIGSCATTTSLTVTVNQPVTPTFDPVATICNGDALTALPTTSNNGYTGSWSPALDNTATTTYTFTPDAGQCANTASLTITVNQPVTPTFDPVAAICNGDALSTLPTTSNNGYTGSWSPALNNALTTTYTFTPDAGQCATTASLIITVNQPVTPTFNSVAPICNGETLSALPTTSNNGYTGSWSPALDNTTTTTYTFTPDAGQCAAIATLTITVNQPTTVPTFTAIAPICNGGSFILPATSNNGITGTWAPAIDNTATTTYTFTPDAGQCGVSTTLTVTVNQPVTPTFGPIGPICNGDPIFNLPLTSSNGISGSWSPIEDNTTTTTYTFTPNSGACATSTTLTVVVIDPTTPTFDPVAPICSGAILTALPTVSNNSYSGTWSPALDNTTTTTYTFTPDPGQCATSATLTITVNQAVTPTFNSVAPICNGDSLSALPTTSINGISGSWSPALNNTATTTYTFTPDAGQCAATATLTITVNQPVTPTFIPVASICNGDPLLALPTISINGITGSWSPALDNTLTTTYTFTPDSGQCAATTTMTITVHTTLTPTGSPIQVFDVSDLNDATIADLVVSPSSVNWYASLADALSLNNPLSLTTVLTSGATYYAVAFSATCPSIPFAVLVTVNLDNGEFDDVHFAYYPNPTSSVVNISYSRNITKVTLIDMLGQVLSSQQTNATEVQVDLSRLAEATYFIKVVSDDKEKTIKVIKQR